MRFDSDVRGILVVAVVATSLAVPAGANAEGADHLWEVTTKMEMPGMPMAMPAQVRRVCVARSHKDEDLIPRGDNCRVLDSKRAGNKLACTMACTGDEPMNVTGELTYAADSYEGRMRMKSPRDPSMEMTQTFAGKRVGACTARQ